MRAHTDPELFARWVGPDAVQTRIEQWDARSGGSWRFVSTRDGEEYGFRGCFHEVRPDRIVQTFTFEGEPDGVALETLWFEDLGNGRTRLHAQSLVDSFESRDAWLRSGMEIGVNEGYAKLDKMLADGTVWTGPPSGTARSAAAFTDRVRGTRVVGRAVAGRRVDRPRRRAPPDGLVPRVPRRRRGIELPHGRASTMTRSVAWQAQCDAVQALLDDPAPPTWC